MTKVQFSGDVGGAAVIVGGAVGGGLILLVIVVILVIWRIKTGKREAEGNHNIVLCVVLM